MCFAFLLIFSIFAAKNNTFPIRETKKQKVPHKSVWIARKVPHKNVIDFAIS